MNCYWAYFRQNPASAPSPYILSLELWNECNAGCLFCRDKKGVIHDLNPAGGPGRIAKGKLPANTATTIIDQLKNDILMAVLYTNGEPLLYPDLSHVIRFASERRVATMIATNGLTLTNEKSQEILSAGLDFIKIQLSGFTQEIYSIQIRYGNVETLKDNIRNLAKINREGGYKTVILIDYILYNYNRHQLPLVREFCRKLGVMLSIRPGNPSWGLEDKEPPLSTEELPLKMSCDWLWKATQVNWNGEILPCCEAVVWSGAKPYTTFQEGVTQMKDIWNGAAAKNMRHTMTKKGRGSIDMCSRCLRKGVCFKW